MQEVREAQANLSSTDGLRQFYMHLALASALAKQGKLGQARDSADRLQLVRTRMDCKGESRRPYLTPSVGPWEWRGCGSSGLGVGVGTAAGLCLDLGLKGVPGAVAGPIAAD